MDNPEWRGATQVGEGLRDIGHSTVIYSLCDFATGTALRLDRRLGVFA